MSRFDFDDDGEKRITWQMWDWNLTRAIASAKGQARLREFREALLAVPGHRLIEDKIADLNGDVCAVGAFAAYKRVQKGKTWAEATADLNLSFHPVHEPFPGKDGIVRIYAWGESETDPWTTQALAVSECGLNRTLAWFIGYANDEGDFDSDTPEGRWQKAYEWVCKALKEQPDPTLIAPRSEIQQAQPGQTATL